MDFRRVKQIQEKIMQGDSMDKVSVIIRNRNEEQYIGFAIQSVLDNLRGSEIIIVDNNSTDDSLNVVSMFRPILKENLKIVNIDSYSPGAALNEGVKHCKYDTVLILSAHAQITDICLHRLKIDLRDHVAVFGNQSPIYRGKKISKRYIWSHFTCERHQNLRSHIEHRHFLHNAFCFYNKHTLLENPFDEDLSGKEDRYWAIDMVKKGHTYMYDGENQYCNHFWTPNGATWKGIG